MPDYALFDFSRVQNIWVKVALGQVKNSTDFQRNLQFPILRAFSCKDRCVLVYFYSSMHDNACSWFSRPLMQHKQVIEWLSSMGMLVGEHF
jgi:hypothetical protein